MLTYLSSVRYAAPPTGKLRWQAPQAPVADRSSVLSATKQPPLCPQSGAGKVIDTPYELDSHLGDEDCLFLNVFAPPGAKDLPVFFWIRKSIPCTVRRHELTAFLNRRRWLWSERFNL